MSDTNIFEGSVLGSTPEERREQLKSGLDQQLVKLRQYLVRSMNNNKQNKDSYEQYQDVLVNEVDPEMKQRNLSSNSMHNCYAISLECDKQKDPNAFNVFLPHQSPLGTFAIPKYLPSNEWPATFLCLVHGHSYVHSPEDIRCEFQQLSPDGSMPLFWQIKCKCRYDDCEKSHVIYTARIPSEDLLRQQIQKLKQRNMLHIPCGSHELLLQEEAIELTSFEHKSFPY
jgi:hypothetical protein